MWSQTQLGLDYVAGRGARVLRVVDSSWWVSGVLVAFALPRDRLRAYREYPFGGNETIYV